MDISKNQYRSTGGLCHKWDVKNGFTYVLQFFSLISDGLVGVIYVVKVFPLDAYVVSCPACTKNLERYLANIVKGKCGERSARNVLRNDAHQQNRQLGTLTL